MFNKSSFKKLGNWVFKEKERGREEIASISPQKSIV